MSPVEFWVAVLSGSGVGADQPGAVGVDDGLHAVAQAELGEDAGDVGFDCLVAEEQFRGDLGVGVADRY